MASEASVRISIFRNVSHYPLDKGRKLNVHKTFGRRPETSSERLMYVQFMFYIQWVSLNLSFDLVS